jgi:hypothetical protein
VSVTPLQPAAHDVLDAVRLWTLKEAVQIE